MFDTCSIQGQWHNRETLINFEPTSYHHIYTYWLAWPHNFTKSNTFHFASEFVNFHKREKYNIKNEFDNVNNVCVLPLHVSLLGIYDVARVSMDFLNDNHIRTLPWPALSPDLKLIKHLWDELGRRVRNGLNPPETLDELRRPLFRSGIIYHNFTKYIMHIAQD
jgi:hypothetical protein